MPALSLLVGVIAACLTCGVVAYAAGVYRGIHIVQRQQEEEIADLRAELHDKAQVVSELREDKQWLTMELDARTSRGGDAA